MMPTVEQAIAFYHAGRLAEAEAICRQVLAAQPAHADAQRWLGVIALATGHFAEAAELIAKAIALAPARADYHSDLGAAFRLLGRLDEAVACFRRAAELQPDLPDAHLNLGEALTKLGRFEEAIPSCRRGLALRPDYAAAHNNLGNALAQTGQREEALACFQRALALQPGYAEAHNNLGNVLAQMERWDEAAGCFRRALALSPDYAEAHNNLGKMHIEAGRVDDAIACSQRALALDPDLAEAHGNLGLALTRKGMFEQAVACYRRALALRPELVIVRWNLSLLLLLLGQFEEGWREHEWRLRCLTLLCPRHSSPATRWDGAPAAGRTLLLHAEQGIGDTIHFMRYVPLVRERAQAARVIVECQPGLARLLAHSGEWNAEIVAHDDRDDSALPAFDLHLPMHSLPMALRMFDPLPMAAPYLRADPGLRAEWRERLRPGFRVGLAWAGSPAHKDDRRRSIDPAQLSPLLRVAGVSFYSLQVEVSSLGSRVSSELPKLETRNSPFRQAQGPEPAEGKPETLPDFADTAALMAELDLVITVDTAAAHLAGALGRPVWTLLPSLPDWRWGLDREDTPWYPTMRLFRQRTMGDWDEVVQRVAAELSTMTQ